MDLTNLRGDVRLEWLRIVRWSGEPPREVQADQARIHRSDGSIVYGQVTRFDAASREFVVKSEAAETRIAPEKISSVFLSRPGRREASGASRGLSGRLSLQRRAAKGRKGHAGAQGAGRRRDRFGCRSRAFARW